MKKKQTLREPAKAPAKTGGRFALLHLFGKRLLVAVVMTAVFFGGAEAILRVSGFTHTPREKKLWKPTVAGFIRTFEYYIPTRFAPPGYLWISEPNTIHTDRYGFRKPEIPIRKEPGKYRVAFLGGSTTQGANRPYPERTIRLLNAVAGTNRFEMLNIACSSYSTHQSVMALERWGLPRQPDLVIIYHGWNDPYVADDGYSDHEKDILMAVATGERPNPARRLASLRIYQGLGWLAEKMDRRWPRVRVPPHRFERNLEKMVAMTRDAGIRTMIFVRPYSERRPLPAVTETAALAYKKAGYPEDPVARYTAIHRDYSDIQRRVSSRHRHVEAFDAYQVLQDIQARHAAGEFGPDIQIFMQDAIHIFEFAEELLAIELACAIAPELAEKVRAFVETPGYHVALSREFLEDDQAFEAAWHARQALRLAGGSLPEAEELLRRAEAEFEFVRLFREGRWGGTDEVFESKIAKLQRCLEIRPSDYGVCLQIFRVCHLMGRIGEAAEAMRGFRPANVRDRYQWLLLTMQSHAAVGRWPQAAETAREILSVNPRDPDAQALLRALGG